MRIKFRNGFSVGFAWIHCNGESSKTSALIAAYHPTKSITWLWALDWSKPSSWIPSAKKLGKSAYVSLPVLGCISFRWQSPMWVKDNA